MDVGSTVTLKSGGPLMTIEGKTLAGHFTCVWQDRDGKLHRATFAPELLIDNDDEPPSIQTYEVD